MAQLIILKIHNTKQTLINDLWIQVLQQTRQSYAEQDLLQSDNQTNGLLLQSTLQDTLKIQQQVMVSLCQWCTNISTAYGH